MTSIYTYPILIVIAVVYYLWRKRDAINARGAIAEDIDTYLGEEHPDELKDLVYHGFKQSLNGFVPVIAGFVYISTVFSKKPSLIQNLFAKHGKAETKKALKLLMKTVFVNIVLSPVSYLVYFTMIFCSLLIKLSFTALKNSPNRLFKNVINKTESSFIKAVS